MRWTWRILLILLVFAVGIAGGVYWLRASGPAFGPTATPTAHIAEQPEPGAPRVELAPDAGYAGTRVEVRGAGWPASTMVILVLEDAAGRSGVLAASAANDAGELRTSFTYPAAERWLRADVQTVVAYTADESVSITTQFDLVAPAAGTPTTATSATSPASPSTSPSVSPSISATVITPAATGTPVPTATPPPTPTETATPTVLVVQGWLGEYWNNSDLSGAPALIRDDAAVQFNWGASSPAHAVQADDFSARWTRTVEFPAGDSADSLYRFTLDVDDGARLYIDGQLVLDAWTGGPHRAITLERTVSAGPHRLRLDYHEVSGPAFVALDWERLPAPTPTPPPTPTSPPPVTNTAAPPAPSAAAPVQLSVRVADGRDDVEQEADGSINRDSDELDMVDHEEDGPQTVGVRFQNVEIPPGVTVTNASIVFTGEEPSDAPTTLRVQGEATGDAHHFNSGRNSLTRRARTAAAVEWPNIPPWQTPGEQHPTPNLAPIVQETVNRDDWRSGNALAFIITGRGLRLAETYEGAADKAPLLVVEYVPPSGP